MPFGLSNAPSVFQRLMNRVLAPYIGRFVMVYLDDIVIFSRSAMDHDEHVRLVLEALRTYGLKAKPSKCSFNIGELKLLGHVVSAEGTTTDPEKVKAIQDMAPPTDVRGVRAFLGMTGYYRQYMPEYARIARPLTELTKKHARFHWGEEQDSAWRQLRDNLISTNVMAYPCLDRPYKLYTDACDYAVGAILVQEDDAGVERPVQYVSKQLTGAQLRWATIEKEAFAVIHALKKLRPYLYDATFTIYTDHKPLKALFVSEIKNTRIQRWAVLIAEYGAPIEYRKGPNNIRADMLSRIRPLAIPTQDVAATEEEDPVPWGFDQLDRPAVRRAQQQMAEYAQGEDEDNGYILIDGLLYTLVPPSGKAEYPRLVLPPEMRGTVMRRAHEEVGHQGTRKTLERLQEAYKWPRQRDEVREITYQCARCAVHRTQQERPPPTDMPIAQHPAQIVGMDMCGPFATSRLGNRYLLTVIDHATGWVEAKPLTNKTAANVLHYLEAEYIPRYGPPEVLGDHDETVQGPQRVPIPDNCLLETDSWRVSSMRKGHRSLNLVPPVYAQVPRLNITWPRSVPPYVIDKLKWNDRAEVPLVDLHRFTSGKDKVLPSWTELRDLSYRYGGPVLVVLVGGMVVAIVVCIWRRRRLRSRYGRTLEPSAPVATTFVARDIDMPAPLCANPYKEVAAALRSLQDTV